MTNYIIQATFQDRLDFNPTTKKGISIRDGVVEYAGIEIGIEPPEKMFKVYRSPAAIAGILDSMVGIPLYDRHVDSEENSKSVGRVVSAEAIDLFDDSTDSRIGLENKIEVDEIALLQIENGKRELSLSYLGELIPHEKYDFEQKNLKPMHLAIVDSGRCGSRCSFVDKKYQEMPPMADKKTSKKKTVKPELAQIFCDAEGMPNLQTIVETAMGLPDALKMLPLQKLMELMPMFQEVIKIASNVGVQDEGHEDDVEDPDKKTDPENKEKKVDDKKNSDGEKVLKVEDSAEFKNALAAVAKKSEKKMADHTDVVVRAAKFLDSEYSFDKKTTLEIMRDSLEIYHPEVKFEDNEVSAAFKMLKFADSPTKNFGKNDNKSSFAALEDKEI